MDPPVRRRLRRSALRACGASVFWALVVGSATIVAGVVAGSVALLAFGLDSVVDGSASGMLIWRFRMEGRSPDGADRVEQRAVRLVGLALLLAALYAAVQAIRGLATRSGPARTTVGLALATASLLVLPLLAMLKLRLATRLKSAALRGDGILTAAGAALAGAALLGLAASNAFGWWWADAVAALAIAAALGREGLQALFMSSPLPAEYSP